MPKKGGIVSMDEVRKLPKETLKSFREGVNTLDKREVWDATLNRPMNLFIKAGHKKLEGKSNAQIVNELKGDAFGHSVNFAQKVLFHLLGNALKPTAQMLFTNQKLGSGVVDRNLIDTTMKKLIKHEPDKLHAVYEKCLDYAQENEKYQAKNKKGGFLPLGMIAGFALPIISAAIASSTPYIAKAIDKKINPNDYIKPTPEQSKSPQGQVTYANRPKMGKGIKKNGGAIQGEWAYTHGHDRDLPLFDKEGMYFWEVQGNNIPVEEVKQKKVKVKGYVDENFTVKAIEQPVEDLVKKSLLGYKEWADPDFLNLPHGFGFSGKSAGSIPNRHRWNKGGVITEPKKMGGQLLEDVSLGNWYNKTLSTPPACGIISYLNPLQSAGYAENPAIVNQLDSMYDFLNENKSYKETNSSVVPLSIQVGSLSNSPVVQNEAIGGALDSSKSFWQPNLSQSERIYLTLHGTGSGGFNPMGMHGGIVGSLPHRGAVSMPPMRGKGCKAKCGGAMQDNVFGSPNEFDDDGREMTHGAGVGKKKVGRPRGSKNKKKN